jgi:hypothetical protein
MVKVGSYISESEKEKEDMQSKKPCVICKQPIGVDPNGWDGGHNAEPVSEGRCCGLCNDEFVFPARILQYRQHQLVVALSSKLSDKG